MNPQIEKLIEALEWAVEWIDDCSSMDPDTMEAVHAIRALLKEVQP